MTAFRNRTAIPLSSNQTMTVTEDSTAISYEWEYYYDYLDPVIVDESKLKYNKYSIVIILWITLAAFVGLLFLSLNLMSHSGTLTKKHRFKMKRNHRASCA